MKHIWIILLLTTSGIYSSGQSTYILSGYVYDAKTGEALIGATVFDTVSFNGTTSNEYGFYSLRIASFENTGILISFVGYESRIITPDPENKQHINVGLNPGLEIDGVTIKPDRHSIVESLETGVVRLPVREVKKLPNLFGEVDIIKALQQTPGVQSGGEGKSELYVRGGSPDQNLILLDDVPLYYVAHFGGFLSIFNVDAINDVKLIKGGFPARYGSRLSSVLDIRMKEGNLNKYSVQGMLGLLSSKVMAEGPLAVGKSSFMISARHNTVPVFRALNDGMDYRFHDINAKVNYRLSDKDRVFASFYGGGDNVGFNKRTEFTDMQHRNKWGNIMGALRWNRIINPSLFANFTIASTNYRYITHFENHLKTDTLSREINSRILTGINDILFKADLDYAITPKYELKFGVNATHHSFLPNNENYSITQDGLLTIDETYDSKVAAREYSVYTENIWNAGWLMINAGLRYSYFHNQNTGYNSFDPRILVNIPLRHDFAIKYSFSQMLQYIHLLNYSGAGMPSNYWMPSTDYIRPSRSTQNSLGIVKTFDNGNYELSVESYYKKMNHLIAFKPGESLVGHLASWEEVVESGGKGNNYGIEVFLQKVSGRTTGWAGIALSRALRRFEQLNNGRTFAFSYDRPVDVNLVWNYELRENIIVSMAWNYGSGYPVTLASERFVIHGYEVLLYDDINSSRMRDFHRLDLAVNFPAKTQWGERNWTISIFNVYNRKNPYHYFYNREFDVVSESGSGGMLFTADYHDLKLYQRTLFGFLPSFAFSFKF